VRAREIVGDFFLLLRVESITRSCRLDNVLTAFCRMLTLKPNVKNNSSDGRYSTIMVSHNLRGFFCMQQIKECDNVILFCHSLPPQVSNKQ